MRDVFHENTPQNKFSVTRNLTFPQEEFYDSINGVKYSSRGN